MDLRRAGFALVAVLLTSAVLFLIVTITVTMAFSGRRSAADRTSTLMAQFAAESGLASAQANLRQASLLMQALAVPNSPAVSISDIQTHVKNFCGVGSLTPISGSVDYATGFEVCQANPGDQGSNRYSLFVEYIPSAAYPSGLLQGGTTAAYWQKIFSGTNAPSYQVQVSSSGSAVVAYDVQYALKPLRVRAMNGGGTDYSFDFQVSRIRSVGTVTAGGNVVGKRTIEQQIPNNANTFSLRVNLPAFSQYVHFRNITTSTGGSQLYYDQDEVLDGPVHTNGTPGFANSTATPDGPLFLGRFTTASTTRATCCNGNPLHSDAQMFPNFAPQFGVPVIPVPTNSNNQLRAAIGGDASDASAVSATEVQTAFGAAAALPNGVYYSAGPNTSSTWLGGIYVKGDVDSLTFSTTNPGGQQVITIVQGLVTTTFTKNANGTWTITDGSTTHTMNASPSFNGMIYVGGAVLALQGNGNNQPDIASGSQITLTTTGNVILKNDITYTDDPNADANAKNVLGIFSSNGAILADGQNNQDLNINASIMATYGGLGFGTVNFTQSRGSVNGRKPRINLVGGLIENQSQTVGVVGGGGYARNYKYDQRYLKGFAPPFFPTQETWATKLDKLFDMQLTTYRQKGN